MTLFRSLAVAGWALRSAARQAAKPSLWIPFLLITALQVLGLVAVLAFYRPGISAVILPLVRSVGGDAATHFPTFYVALPILFARWDLVLGVVVASLTTGAAAALFARAYGQAAPPAWSTAVRRYLPLAGVALVAALLSLGVFVLGSRAIQSVVDDRALRWITRLAMMAVFVGVESFLIYASVAIVLEGRGLLAAIRDSVGVAAALFIPTVVVVGLPVFLVFPLDYLTERSNLFLGKLRPELMTDVLLVKIAAELILTFLLVGAVTRIYLWRRREEA